MNNNIEVMNMTYYFIQQQDSVIDELNVSDVFLTFSWQSDARYFEIKKTNNYRQWTSLKYIEY